MNGCKIGRINLTKHYYVTRIGLLTLIFFFAWLGTDTKEVAANESDFVYREIYGDVEITNYVGTEKDVIIPDTLGGKPVKRIGHSAFSFKQLTSVTIPDSVIEIGFQAFFMNKLTEVTIPNSVEKIGDYAFSDNQLTFVRVGSNVENIKGSILANNPLETIQIDENNSNFRDIDEKGLYTADGTVLVVGTVSGEIAAKTTKIGDHSFSGRGLTSIHIPSQVEKIGILAFDRNALVHLTIPDSVTQIGYSAFSHNLLKEVYIGGQVEEIDGNAFAYNQLTKVTIPDSVTYIGFEAFPYHPYLVLSGSCGTAAERYAQGNDIPFLSDCQPLVIQFNPNGSSGEEVKQATTKVTVYSYDELVTEAYYRWTNEESPPSFDETTWTPFANGQELSKSDGGEWYLHIYVKDSANNYIYHSSQLFRVVDLHPQIHVSATVGDAAIPYNEGEWVNQQVHVTIWTEDVNMQELRIKIRHDGENEELTVGSEDQFSFIRTFTESGIYQLEITATNERGRTSTKTYTIKMSLDGLQLKVTLEQDDGTVLTGQWTNQQSVTANVYAYHVQGLSVTDVVYSLNEGGTWVPYLGPLTFADEGRYPLWVKAEDEIGNSRMDQLHIGIDRTKPDIHFEPDGNDEGLRDISSKVIVTDSLSGIDEDTLRYLWSKSNQPLDAGADWSAFRQGERLSYTGTSGDWYLHIRAQDRAENEGYQVSLPFRVQADDPDDGDDRNNGEDDNDGNSENTREGSSGERGGSGAYSRSNANISELHVSVGQLSPVFSEEITDYRVQVGQDVMQLTITVKTVQREATITINGEQLSSGQETVQLSLVEDTHLIEILITAEDGTEKKYRLTIEREKAKTDEPKTTQRSFTDIAGHWAGDEIKLAAERGLVNGYPDGSFKPNNPVTRAEFTVMLIGALQLEGTSMTLTFTDEVQIGSWAQHAIARAVQLGIVAGYEDGSFRPDAEITRAEIAVMIARALQLPTVSNAFTGFADDEEIPHWAKGAVKAIRNLGIVAGRGDNHFVANETATRAETTILLLRILEQQLGIH